MNKSELDLEKKSINLRKGDWMFLTQFLKDKGIQPSTYIRTLISVRIDAVRASRVDISDLTEEVDL